MKGPARGELWTLPRDLIRQLFHPVQILSSAVVDRRHAPVAHGVLRHVVERADVLERDQARLYAGGSVQAGEVAQVLLGKMLGAFCGGVLKASVEFLGREFDVLLSLCHRSVCL